MVNFLHNVEFPTIDNMDMWRLKKVFIESVWEEPLRRLLSPLVWAWSKLKLYRHSYIPRCKSTWIGVTYNDQWWHNKFKMKVVNYWLFNRRKTCHVMIPTISAKAFLTIPQINNYSLSRSVHNTRLVSHVVSIDINFDWCSTIYIWVS